LKRSSNIAPVMAWLGAFALLNSVASVHGYQEKVREIYMYRATKDPTKNPYVMENVDMADLVGAMKYVHSKSSLSTPSPYLIAQHASTTSILLLGGVSWSKILA